MIHIRGHQHFWNCQLLLVDRFMWRATSLIYISEIRILLNLPSIILVLIFVNVQTFVKLMLFSEHARGRLTWSFASDLVPAGTTLVTPGAYDKGTAYNASFSTFSQNCFRENKSIRCKKLKYLFGYFQAKHSRKCLKSRCHWFVASKKGFSSRILSFCVLLRFPPFRFLCFLVKTSVIWKAVKLWLPQEFYHFERWWDSFEKN